jgi:pilus assembly protein Flp/PilA
MFNKWEKMEVKMWEVGQGLVEYALILVLVAVVVIVILALLGPAIGNVYQQIIDALSPVGG